MYFNFNNGSTPSKLKLFPELRCGNVLLWFVFLIFFLVAPQLGNAQANIAQGKAVTASSGSTNLSNLVDGNFGTVATSGSAQTGNNAEWFLVDLGADYFIDRITIGANPAAPDRMRRFEIVTWPSVVTDAGGIDGSYTVRNPSTYFGTWATTSLYNRLLYNPSTDPAGTTITAANTNLGPAFVNNQFSANIGLHKARYVLVMNLQRAAFDPSEIQVFQSNGGAVREFTNGGFESQSSTGATQTPEKEVTGWSTTEGVSSAPPTDGGYIEVWQDNTTPGDFNLPLVRSKAGKYFAELNAFSNGQLEQQPICVLPGETFTWSFAHRGRGGVDVMALRIDDKDVAQFSDNNIQGGMHQAKILPTGAGTTAIQVGSNSINTANAIINTLADANGWAQWTGRWTNTSGAAKSVTFGFRAVSAVLGIGAGNYIDEVSLASLSALASLKTAFGNRAGSGPECVATANLPKLRIAGRVTATNASIQLNINGGTATRGVDYLTPTAATGVITIPIPPGVYDGSDLTAISLAPYLKIVSDAVNPEGDETITGVLQNPTGLVVIGDAGACETSAVAGIFEYTITNTPPLTATVAGTNVSCLGGNNGTALPTVTGGCGPYTYSWNTTPVQTTAKAINLAPGTYTVTITDTPSGETTTAQVTITQPSAAVSSTGAITKASAAGVKDGAIALTPAGGTGPYTYLWSNTATTKDISALAPGTYNVTITDANGCTAVNSFVVQSIITANNITYPTKINNESAGTTIPTLTSADSDGSTVSYTISTIPPASQGQLKLPDGTVLAAGAVLTPQQAGQLVFVPNAAYVGDVTFTYTATDNDGNVDPTPATYTLTVAAPPVTTAVTNQNAISNQSPGTTIDPLAADDSKDGGTIGSYTIVTLPPASQGVLTLADGSLVTAGQVLTPAQSAGLKFKPVSGYTGPVTFTYTSTDNSGFTDSSPAVYTLNVVRPTSDLALTKTANPKPAVAGQALTYTITLTNNGPGAILPNDTLTVTDNLPAGFAASSTTANTGTYTAGTGAWTGLNLSTGQSATITIVGTVAPGATGTLNNTANLTLPATITDPVPANNTATDATPISQKPVLTVVKTGQSSVTAGTQVQYTIKVSNTGSSNAIGATIADAVPNTLGNVTWSAVAAGTASITSGATGTGNNVSLVGNIPTGAANFITVTVNGTVSAAATGSLNNTATATPSAAQPDGTAGTSTFTSTINSSTGVTLIKNAPATASSGGNISYQLELGNNGPSNAPVINVADVISAQLSNVSWTSSATGAATITSGGTGTGNNLALVANVPAGTANKITITINGTINSSFTGNLTNTASATPQGGTAVNASATTAVSSKPSFTFSKTGPATANSGQTIQYVLTAKNTGQSNSTASVISDAVPATLTNVSWTATVKSGVANITAGATGTGNAISVTANTQPNATIEVLVTAKVPSNFIGTIDNSAAITPSESGTTPISSSVTTTVGSKPTLAIQKLGPATIAAGQVINYTLKVTNTGTSDAVATAISDAIPASILNPSWTTTVEGQATVTAGAGGTGSSLSVTGNIPAGAGNAILVAISGTVNPSQTADISNTATVTPAEPGTSPVNSTPVVTTVTQKPTVVVTKTGPATANAGQTITYQIDVVNNGPSNATALPITDNVPVTLTNVSWTATALGTSAITTGATGSANAVAVTADLKAGAANKVSILVTGTVPSNQAPITINNTASATPVETGTTVTSAPVSTVIGVKNNLKLTKAAPAAAAAGQQITYTILAENKGPSDATNAVITDAVPTGISNVAWTTTLNGNATVSAGATGTGSNLNITANIPFGTNNSVLVTVTGTVDPTFAGTSLSNTATVTPSEAGNPPVNSNTTVTNIGKIADLNIVKTGPQTVVAGQTVTYNLTVTNTGPSLANNVSIADGIPEGLTNVSWSATTEGAATIVGPSSGTGTPVLTANIGTVATDKVNVVVTGTVAPDYAQSTLVNTATATPETGVTDPTPATSAVTSSVSRVADVRMVKSGPANAGAGETINYTLNITNEGLSKAVNTHIVDAIPANINSFSWTVLTGSGATATATNGTGAVDFNADIPKGGTVQVLVTAVINPSTAVAVEINNTASATTDPAITDSNVANNEASAITKITPNGNYRISKTGPNTANVGDNIRYDILVENTGTGDITGAVIKDAIPAGLTNVTWTVASENGTTNVATGVGDVDLTADLSGSPSGTAGGKTKVTVYATVDQSAGLNILNTANVQVSPDGPIVSDKTTTVIHSADISIVKTGPEKVSAGGVLKYTIVAQNFGPADADDVSILDDLPALIENGATWVATFNGTATLASGTATGTGDIAANSLHVNLPAGAANKVTIEVTATLPANTAPQQITNTATYQLPTGSPVTDFNANNNSSAVVTDIVNTPQLVVQKSGPGSANSGDQINYNIRVSNTGLSNATNVNIADVVPAEITAVSWTSTLGAGANLSAGETGTGNNLTATGDIPAGSFIDFQVTGKISPDYAGFITNTAQAAIGTGTPEVSTPVVTNVSKEASLSIVKNAPLVASSGQTITYTIQVENAGPSNLLNSSISDSVPTTLTDVTWSATATNGAVINAGATGTGNAVLINADLPLAATVLVSVSGKVPSGFEGTIKNTAVVTPSETGVPTNSNETTTTVSRKPILNFQKSAPSTVNAGERLAYALVLENNGTSDAVATQLSDIIDPALTGVTWTSTVAGGAAITAGDTGTGNTFGATVDVPVGGKVTFNISGLVAPTTTGSIANTATATPAEPDVAPISASTNTVVTSKVGLIITKSGPSTANAGEAITYLVSVKNNGPSTATGIAIADAIPANLVSWSWSVMTSGSANITNGGTSGTGDINLIADLGSATNDEVRIMVSGIINPSFSGNILNTATATPATGTGDAVSSVVNTNVIKIPTLTIAKTGTASATAGATVSYQILVVNNGLSNASNAAITDAVSASLTGVTWTATAQGGASILTGANGTGNNVNVTADIPAGANNTITVNITGTLIGTASGYVLNTAQLTPSEPGTTAINSQEVKTAVKPSGVDDAKRTLTGTPITVDVKANDAGAAGNTVYKNTDPANGTATVNPDGTITYAPAPGFTGTDTFTYRLQSPEGILSDPITVTITVYNAGIELKKVASTTPVGKAGDVISYTFTVTNTGQSPLTDVIVADAGADVGSISPATISSLAIGASATATARHTLTAADVNSASYSNQASVSGKDENGNTVSDLLSDDPSTPLADDPTVVPITPSPAISLVKTASLQDNGKTVVYTFTVTNTGNITLSTIELTDAKLGIEGQTIAVDGGLAPGASVAYTASYTLTQADKDAGTVSNTATASGATAGGLTASDVSGTAGDNDSPTVLAVPKSPVAVNDTGISVPANSPAKIELTGNDTGNGTALDPASITIIQQPAHGKVTVNGDGTVTYTPDPGYSGPDSFSYTVKDVNGFVSNVATVTLEVQFGGIKIPNMFTPNGDGQNDKFEIRGLNQYIGSELVVVNRWGSEVYRSKGGVYLNDWDGQGLAEGTYYYLLRVRKDASSQWEVKKGYITLMRNR